MNCKNCNSSIEKGVRFCPKCGASVADSFASHAKPPFSADDPVSVDDAVPDDDSVPETETSITQDDAVPVADISTEQKTKAEQSSDSAQADEAVTTADASAEQKPETAQSAGSVHADVSMHSKLKVSVPKFVTRHYIRRTALYSSLAAISILVITLCLTFLHNVNSPVTFSTYHELERISQQSGQYTATALDNIQTFTLGPNVGLFNPSAILGPSISSNRNNTTVNYINFQGNYVVVENLAQRTSIPDSDLVLSVDTLHLEHYKQDIRARIDALHRASTTGLEASSFLIDAFRDALDSSVGSYVLSDDYIQQRYEVYIANIEREIESLQNISNNLSPIRLTVASRDSCPTFPVLVGWGFAILLVIIIFPAMRTWLFFIAPAKSGVCRYLALFGDVNTLFEECEKSFAATTLLTPCRVEINREFVVLFKPSYVFIAPVRAAQFGNLDKIASSGRSFITQYTFRLNLHFSHGIEESIRVKHEMDGTNALSYLKRLNPEFSVQNQRLMRCFLWFFPYEA